MKKLIKFLFVIYSVFFAQILTAKNIWVDVNSGVNGDGVSQQSAFRSIQSAADIAKAGDTIVIRGGVYREKVTPANSGTDGADITFTSFNNEKVTISGANKLAGWSQHTGDIYKIAMPVSLGVGNDQIFVNSVMMQWARWPNSGYEKVLTPLWDNDNLITSAYQNNGYDVDLTDFDLAGSAKNWVGAYMHLVTGKEWLHQTGAILTGSSGNILKVRFDNLPSGDAYKPVDNNRYFITGTLKALDAAGEWYRGQDGMLYLWQPGGMTPDNSLVEYKVRKIAVDLSGKKNIVIKNINIFSATISMDENSSDIALDSINAKYISHYDLIGTSPWYKGTTDSGLIVHGNNNQVINSNISLSSGNGISLHGAGHKILNNTIHDINYMGTDSAGIFTSYLGAGPSSEIEIAYNEIYNSGRGLIVHRYILASSIHHNDLHHALLQSKDSGALYTYGVDVDGTNKRGSNNKGDNNSKGTVIAYNVLYNNYPFGDINEEGVAVGIYLDSGSASYVVTRNIVYDSTFAMIINSQLNDQNHLIINNTLIGMKYAIFSRGMDEGENMTGTEIINNILVGYVSINFENWNITSSNYYINNYVNIDTVGFKDYINNDYSLRLDSPAIDNGVNDIHQAYTLGYIGDLPDAGAVEFSSNSFNLDNSISNFIKSRSQALLSGRSLTIKAGLYDILGPGVSYYDKTMDNSAESLSWGGMRSTEAVDAVSSGFVGWIQNGEWLEYTVFVEDAGKYNINLNELTTFDSGKGIVASTLDSGLNSVNRNLGTVEGSNGDTGLSNVFLNSGYQKIRLEFSGTGFGFGSFTIEKASTPIGSTTAAGPKSSIKEALGGVDLVLIFLLLIIYNSPLRTQRYAQVRQNGSCFSRKQLP